MNTSTITAGVGVYNTLGGSLYQSENSVYQCENCDKEYAHKQSLYNHQRYNCGQLPIYNCKYCQYTTRWKYSVKSHILRKHPKIKFKPMDLNKMMRQQTAATASSKQQFN